MRYPIKLNEKELNAIEKMSHLSLVLYIFLKSNFCFVRGKPAEVYSLYKICKILQPNPKQGKKTEILRIEKIRGLINELAKNELIDFDLKTYEYTVLCGE